MNLIVDCCTLQININKTNVIVFAQAPKPIKWHINNKVVNQMVIKYLVATVNEKCDRRKKIPSRSEQAWRTFISIRNLFADQNLWLELRVRILRCMSFQLFFMSGHSIRLWTRDLTHLKCTYIVKFHALDAKNKWRYTQRYRQ